MKKMIAAMLCIVTMSSVVFIAGCGSGEPQSEVQESTDEDENEKLESGTDPKDNGSQTEVTDPKAGDKIIKDETGENAADQKEPEKSPAGTEKGNASKADGTSSGKEKDTDYSGNHTGYSDNSSNSGSSSSKNQADNDLGSGSGSADTSGDNSNSGQSTAEDPVISQPEHVHEWVEQTSVIHHEEEGHYEEVWVETKAAWEEPVYEKKIIDVCNTCGADVTENAAAHAEAHALAGENGGHHTEVIKVQTGTIQHEAEGSYVQNWVVDKEAWDETVSSGWICSSCGAVK